MDSENRGEIELLTLGSSSDNTSISRENSFDNNPAIKLLQIGESNRQAIENIQTRLAETQDVLQNVKKDVHSLTELTKELEKSIQKLPGKLMELLVDESRHLESRNSPTNRGSNINQKYDQVSGGFVSKGQAITGTGLLQNYESNSFDGALADRSRLSPANVSSLSSYRHHPYYPPPFSAPRQMEQAYPPSSQHLHQVPHVMAMNPLASMSSPWPQLAQPAPYSYSAYTHQQQSYPIPSFAQGGLAPSSGLSNIHSSVSLQTENSVIDSSHPQTSVEVGSSTVSSDIASGGGESQEQMRERWGSKLRGLEIKWSQADKKWVPTYCLFESSDSSFKEIYDEFYTGLNGLISLTELDIHFGTSWRLRSEKNEYTRRRKVARFIKRIGAIHGVDAVCDELTRLFGKKPSARRNFGEMLTWDGVDAMLDHNKFFAKCPDYQGFLLR